MTGALKAQTPGQNKNSVCLSKVIIMQKLS